MCKVTFFLSFNFCHLISIILQMLFFTFHDSYMIVDLSEFPWLAYRFPVGPWVVMSCLFYELDNIAPGAIQYANKQLTWPLDKVPLEIPLQRSRSRYDVSLACAFNNTLSRYVFHQKKLTYPQACQRATT